MHDKDAKEEGLSASQQKFLMGKVDALLDAVACVAMSLPGEEQRALRSAFHNMRDDPRPMADAPAEYRSAVSASRYHVFDRLMLALADYPQNDNEG